MFHKDFDATQAWFVALETITLVILLTFTILSFFLYFVELQIIMSFRKTTFKGPFYRLMFVGIIVDMVSAVNLFTGQVIPARAWFVTFLLAHQNYLGKVFFFITYGGRCIQGSTATILSFCRVFAVKSPVIYRKLNDAHSIYTMQALQLVGAVVAGVMLIPDTYEYIYENQGQVYYSVGSDDSDAEWFYAFVAVMEVFFVLCIVVNNLVTYATFHLRFRKKSTIPKLIGNFAQVSKEKQKRESSLDRMTFIVCCVEIIYFAFVVYSLQINQSMNKRIFYFLYNILCVVYSTFSAWMLLIVSKPITVEFKQKFSNIGPKLTRSISVSAQGSAGMNPK